MIIFVAIFTTSLASKFISEKYIIRCFLYFSNEFNNAWAWAKSLLYDSIIFFAPICLGNRSLPKVWILPLFSKNAVEAIDELIIFPTLRTSFIGDVNSPAAPENKPTKNPLVPLSLPPRIGLLTIPVIPL